VNEIFTQKIIPSNYLSRDLLQPVPKVEHSLISEKIAHNNLQTVALKLYLYVNRI